MLKPVFLVSAAVLVAMAAACLSGRMAEAAPAQAAAAQTSASVKEPMTAGVRNPVTPTAASLAEAKTVYSRDCALCHGDNGNGKSDLATSMQLTMGDWTDPKTLAGKQDAELFKAIRTGDSKMPGEDAGRAKDSVVWNMIYYIRSFSRAQGAVPAVVSAPAGKPAKPATD